jgi:hypothetical protein
LSFAILIALTFFMMRRRVALSAALNVVRAIREILLPRMNRANPNFDRSAIGQAHPLPRISLLQENQIPLKEIS